MTDLAATPAPSTPPLPSSVPPPVPVVPIPEQELPAFGLRLLTKAGRTQGRFLYTAKSDLQEKEDTHFDRRAGGVGIEALWKDAGLEASYSAGFEAYNVNHLHTRFDDAKTSDIYLSARTAGQSRDLRDWKIPATLFSDVQWGFDILQPEGKKRGLWHPLPVVGLKLWGEGIWAHTPRRVEVEDLHIEDTKDNRLELGRVAPVLLDAPNYRSSMYFLGLVPSFSTHDTDLGGWAVEVNVPLAFFRFEKTIYYDLRPEAKEAIDPFLNKGQDFDTKGKRFDQNAGWGTLGVHLTFPKGHSLVLQILDWYKPIKTGRTTVDVSIWSLAFYSALYGYE